MGGLFSNYNQEEKEEKDFTYMSKIITLGETNAGKTSLQKRYIFEKFEKNPIVTLSYDFLTKKVQYGTEIVKFLLFDTAG